MKTTVTRRAYFFFLRIVNNLRLWVFALCCLPIVLVCRIIRPIFWIRFGYFNVNRIGHFVADVAQYLSERELGENPVPTNDIFFFKGKPANHCFEKIANRELKVFAIVEALFLANRLLPGGRKHAIYPAQEIRGSRDINAVTSKVLAPLNFTKTECEQGKEYLSSFGIRENDKYVCLIVRDDSYLKKTFKNVDWNYHAFRNSLISSYVDAILQLNARGYYVFRMGKAVNESLSIGTSKFIDYANSFQRSDFLDIWLVANCCFTISTSTGLDDVAIAFKKPVVFVNHLPVGDCRTGSENFLELFKLLQWKATGRYVGLQEQIDYGILNCYRQSRFDDLGIEVIDNTPDEITAAVLEMEDRISGRWHSTEKNQEKQKRFFEILAGSADFGKRHGLVRGNISSSFLAQQGDWFLQ